jgi:hypothetical protein
MSQAVPLAQPSLVAIKIASVSVERTFLLEEAPELRKLLRAIVPAGGIIGSGGEPEDRCRRREGGRRGKDKEELNCMRSTSRQVCGGIQRTKRRGRVEILRRDQAGRAMPLAEVEGAAQVCKPKRKSPMVSDQACSSDGIMMLCEILIRVVSPVAVPP